MASSATYHVIVANGRAAASGEKKIDLPQSVARFGDILNRERPIDEIGPGSVFVNSTVGGWRQPAGKSLRTTSPRWWGVGRRIKPNSRPLAGGRLRARTEVGNPTPDHRAAEASKKWELRLGCHPETPIIEPCAVTTPFHCRADDFQYAFHGIWVTERVQST